jgi:hypothetical protein
MTYGFPSGFSTFDPSKAFSGGYGNFSGSSSLKSGSGMDPLSAGLGFASAGIGLISGIGQQKTAANIARAQLAAQNAAMLEGREQNKGALAGSLFNQIFGTGTGADISFGREKAAKEFLVGPYAERLMGLGSEESKRERLAAISPESKERARFENRLAIERETASRLAQTNAMFGPISSSYRA